MQNGYTEERLIILQEAETLQLDENKYIECPFCKAKHEKKCNIKKVAAGILYNCLRGSCGKNGIIGSYSRKVIDKPVKQTRTFSGELVPFPHEIWDTCIAKYGIDIKQCKEQGWKYSPTYNRMYMPVYDHRGYQIGESLKAVVKEDKPKVIYYPNVYVPIIHFPIGQEFSPKLVLVEDMISAVKVSNVTYTASLYGTNITDEGILQLRKMGVKLICLMMDGDNAGLAATIKLWKKLMPFFMVESIYLPRDKDPKDLTIEELRKITL